MNSLVAKGMCKQIDVPTHDSLTGKETTAPAYRVTPKGFSYVKSSSELSKSKQTHYYHVRVRGTRSVNDIFLRHLQGLRGVQRQTRFITEDDPEFSKIAIFSYKPIDSDLIRDMARMLVEQRLISAEDAEPAVRRFLIRMSEDSRKSGV